MKNRHLRLWQKLVKIAPHFGFSIFERYVKAYCENKIDDMTPFTVENVSKSADNSAQLQMELLRGIFQTFQVRSGSDY